MFRIEDKISPAIAPAKVSSGHEDLSGVGQRFDDGHKIRRLQAVDLFPSVEEHGQ